MFRDEIIKGTDISDYEDIIPAVYHKRLKRGEITAVAVYDESESATDLFGISVVSVKYNWIEIFWFHLMAESVTTAMRADFMRYCIRKERLRHRNEELAGAFTEFYEADAPGYEDVLLLAGMTVSRVKDNNFEFCLSQVGYRDALKKAAAKLPCKALCDISDDDLDMVMDEIKNDRRIFPVPSPVNWLDYDQEVSCICFDGKKPCGLMLVSYASDRLVIDFLWSAGATAMSVLMYHGLHEAEDIYTPDCKVLVPVVVPKAEQIIQKMVPDALRGDMIEGKMWF